MNSKIKRNALKNEDVKEKLEQIYYVQQKGIVVVQ